MVLVHHRELVGRVLVADVGGDVVALGHVPAVLVAGLLVALHGEDVPTSPGIEPPSGASLGAEGCARRRPRAIAAMLATGEPRGVRRADDEDSDQIASTAKGSGFSFEYSDAVRRRTWRQSTTDASLGEATWKLFAGVALDTETLGSFAEQYTAQPAGGRVPSWAAQAEDFDRLLRGVTDGASGADRGGGSPGPVYDEVEVQTIEGGAEPPQTSSSTATRSTFINCQSTPERPRPGGRCMRPGPGDVRAE